MIFLDYLYTMPNSTVGTDEIVTQTIELFPGFTSLILFFVFFLVFLGGSLRQRYRDGRADYPAWAVVASISMLVTSLLFSIKAGFLRLDWLVIILTVNIASAIWFYLDSKQSEI